MEENQSIDYTDMLSICPQALQVYQQRGLNDVTAAYDIGNILSTNHFYAEAAFLFKLAYNMHSKSPAEYPLCHILWMIRIVALLKGNLPIKDEELEQLKNLSIPFYNYLTGWKQYKENNDALSAISVMQNCYEEFPTGEEADRIYLSIMMDIFNPNPVVSISPRECSKAAFNVIPNNLFMYWDQNPPPEVTQNFDYQKQLGHFNLRIFDKAEATEWLYQNYGVEARHIFLSARHPAEAADFLRIHVINHYGGWWLDADIRIRSIEQFYSVISTAYEHVFLLTDNYVVHNDFFGSVANSPILNECIRTLYHNSYMHKDLFIAYKTGPGVFNRAINRILYRCIKGEAKSPSLIILDHHKFWNVIEDFETPYKTATPHWMAS
ncbi:glycosyltransferase [Commensalibacter oyaizuii]|uniref:Capsular polysaccharide synthesis protein n=1 Tax=Commensalibacter oyaizuii TaxID=3043873 RepID=A0ABT6Q2Z7_9PROT|nr:glycosyltransferase [Commensalibacter sp. TBRC 16381]MDI2091486.1 capsular polysaccharide synthesis protein [Commensalibacter sp. TBRC 16381]